MKLRYIALTAGVAVAVAAAPVVQASPVEGSDPGAQAKFVSDIKTTAGGKKATLKASYKCSEGDALWVSAKETATGEKDKRLKKGGSSETAAAWLQSHRNVFTCDGKSRTEKFTIDKVEDGSKGKLVPGEAWVQFCVTQGGRDLVLSKSGWVGVR